MRIGALIFPTDLTIGTDRRHARWKIRLRVAVGDRTHPHPDEPPHAVARRGRSARGVPAHARPIRRPGRRRGGHRAAQPRHRHLPLAQHHPITLAKTVASLDLVSSGRFLFGIGVGWNEEEMEHHGVVPSTRRAHVRETVLAMKGLWTEEAAAYEGDYVNFSESWSWPKPVRFPHPPVIMGGAGGPVTFRHVIEYCDGWMPIHGRRSVFDRVGELRRQPRRPAAIPTASSSGCSVVRTTPRSSRATAPLASLGP